MKDELEILHDRYARALFMCAEADKNMDKVMKEFSRLNAEWLKNKEFNRLLTHPLITQNEKKTAIQKLVHLKKYCRTTLNFLNVLIDNKRENLMHGVFLKYRDLYDQFKNKVRVVVETAKPFAEKEKALLIKALRLNFREEVDMEINENPELVGGISIQYKDRVYDYSIKSQLHQLKQKLTK